MDNKSETSFLNINFLVLNLACILALFCLFGLNESEPEQTLVQNTSEEETTTYIYTAPENNTSPTTGSTNTYNTTKRSTYRSTTKNYSSRECYVCGESGASQKVGSQWYCSTHAAYVRAFSDDSYKTTTKRYSSGGSYSSGVTGAGGYDMPNESDDSFADYVKRVDPDLYEDIKDRYESLQ